MQITDQSFPPVFGVDPGIVSTYMGDYDQAVASPTGFNLTWGDNRDASHGHSGNHPNVRFATIAVATYGPAVISTSPRGNIFGAVDHVRITFDEAIRPHSMAKISTSIPSFTDPNGNPITVNAVVPVAGSNFTQYDVLFDAHGLAGTYTMQIGPHIRDRMGRLMDQDGDGMPGQPDDGYTATFTIQGPQVLSYSPTGNNNAPGSVHSVRFTFNEPMDPATFMAGQVASFTDPNGNQIPITDVMPVPNTNNTQFDVTFGALGTAGSYTMVIGPDIADPNGNALPGPFTAQFGVFGPSVTGYSPTGNNNLPGRVQSVRFTFNEPMDPATFMAGQVASFTDPNGNQIPITDVMPVPNTNNTQFDVTFAPLGTSGSYTMVIGPDIDDPYGNALQGPFTAQFGVAAPIITAFVSNATFANPPSNVRVTFNEPMDPMTFTPDKVTSFLDPNGNPVTVNSVTPVAGSGNTQFDIAFDPQTVFGTYSMTIGPDIQDPFGNSMSTAFMGTFRYSNEAIVNGGFETGNFMGWTQSGNTGATGVSTGHPHSGMYAADLGPVGSEGFLSQSFATTPGSTYLLVYWLSHDGGTPNQFEAYIDGVVIPGSQILNGNAFAYTEYMFDFTATGTTTELKFGFRQDPAYFHLDDVSVSAGAALAHQGSSRGLALALVTPSAPVAAIASSSASSSPTKTGLNPVDQVFATAGHAQGTSDSAPTAMALAQPPASSDASLEGDLTGWLTM
jgi:hypothetical protein